MADQYHRAATQALTLGGAYTYTHGLTANGSAVAPDHVTVTPEHGASIGVVTPRVTHKGTDVASIILDGQTANPPVAVVTCRVDAYYYPSNLGRG